MLKMRNNNLNGNITEIIRQVIPNIQDEAERILLDINFPDKYQNLRLQKDIFQVTKNLVGIYVQISLEFQWST